jgi:3-oxoacyl-[acyl-carrier protein] reductase
LDLGLGGRACLVAGASRGIGKAIAVALAREGARVIAVARGAEALPQVVDELAAAGGGPHAMLAADVATRDGAHAAVEGCTSAFGGIDVVVANVGKSFARDAAAMDDADLAQSLDMNLWTAARVAQQAVPHLKTRGGGAIAMIASIWGRGRAARQATTWRRRA